MIFVDKSALTKYVIIFTIGEKYGKTSAQIVLRFFVLEGIDVIPKIVKRKRMERNFNFFEFKLKNEDIERIRSLDLGQSLFFSHHEPEIVTRVLFNISLLLSLFIL